MSTATQQRWLSKQEAAEYLGTTERWIRRAMEEGRLPFTKLPGSHYVRFDVRDLDAFMEAGRVQKEAVTREPSEFVTRKRGGAGEAE